jgi:hypothetical protein
MPRPTRKCREPDVAECPELTRRYCSSSRRSRANNSASNSGRWAVVGSLKAFGELSTARQFLRRRPMCVFGCDGPGLLAGEPAVIRPGVFVRLHGLRPSRRQNSAGAGAYQPTASRRERQPGPLSIAPARSSKWRGSPRLLKPATSR